MHASVCPWGARPALPRQAQARGRVGGEERHRALQRPAVLEHQRAQAGEQRAGRGDLGAGVASAPAVWSRRPRVRLMVCTKAGLG